MQVRAPLQLRLRGAVEFEQHVVGDCGCIGDGPRGQRGVRDRHDDLVEQMQRAGRRALARTVADPEVDAFRAQIEYLVVRGDAQVDVGQPRLQAPEARQQPQRGDADARGNRHGLPLARGGERRDGVLQAEQRGVRRAEQPLAFRRERDPAIAALQQRDAEMRFERMHLAADRRLRDAQVLRGECDAHAAADGDEAAHEVQRRETDERR